MTTKCVLVIGILSMIAAGMTSCSTTNTGSSNGGTSSGGGAYHTLSESSLSAESRAALESLTNQVPAAAALAPNAKGILVFPQVIKGAFIIGASHGEGTFFEAGKVTGYYSTSGASYGLQAGGTRYGYALFFMTDNALEYLNKTRGWQIGVGPNVVVVDRGMGRSLTTTTARSDVYAFIFDQNGLMAGLGLRGSRIRRIDR